MKKVFYLVAVAVVSMAITSCGSSVSESDLDAMAADAKKELMDKVDGAMENVDAAVSDAKAEGDAALEAVEDKVDGMVESTTETLEEGVEKVEGAATDMKDAAVEKGTEMKKEIMH